MSYFPKNLNVVLFMDTIQGIRKIVTLRAQGRKEGKIRQYLLNSSLIFGSRVATL